MKLRLCGRHLAELSTSDQAQQFQGHTNINLLKSQKSNWTPLLHQSKVEAPAQETPKHQTTRSGSQIRTAIKISVSKMDKLYIYSPDICINRQVHLREHIKGIELAKSEEHNAENCNVANLDIREEWFRLSYCVV